MNKVRGRSLLIDNSNTRTKFVLSSDGKLASERMVLPTAELSAGRISSLLRGVAYERVLVCSVVPAARPVIEAAFSVPTKFLSAEQALPMDFHYAPPASLGADRVANSLGVALSARFPCVAVDLGTAVTFDVVERRDGRLCFSGGVITPGLACMRGYLATQTAQLPEIEPCPTKRIIGQSTREALQSGCVEGFCCMVDGILNAIANALGVRPYVVATGGDAELFAGRSAHVDTVDPLLTFRGLNAALPYVF